MVLGMPMGRRDCEVVGLMQEMWYSENKMGEEIVYFVLIGHEHEQW